MPRLRVRKLEKKRKRSEVKTEPLADGAGASSAAGAGRAGARGGGGSVSGGGASHCGPPPAKRARVTVKKERKVKVKKEKGKGKVKVEVKSEEKEGGEEEMAFDLAPARRRGGEAEEPLGPPRYGRNRKKNWDGVSRWMHFSSCRAFARSLGLKSEKEWRAWWKVPGQRPEDVPTNPQRVYAGFGWKGYGDFLGTGNVRNGKGTFKSFNEARAFARGLKLSSVKAWYAWSKDHRPSDIPSTPDRTYKEAGWINWGDFLGTGNKRGGQPHNTNGRKKK